MPPQARSTSSLGEPRIPLSFKVVVDPDDLPGIQTQDFKANRAVPPIDVSNELQANMNELMQVIEHEKTLATRMKKSLDDIASVVQTGVEFDREISGAAVVDMQILLFNTRNILKNKNKYMATFRLESNEMQTTARALRNQISEQSRPAASVNPARGSPTRNAASPAGSMYSKDSRTWASPSRTSNENRSMYFSPGVEEDELTMLRRRVQELEMQVSRSSRYG